MNTLDNNIVINVYKIEENGTSTSASWYEMNPNTKEHISTHNFCPLNVSFDPKILQSNENRFTLNFRQFESNEELIKCIKLEETENSSLSLSTTSLNIPIMIRCQNCETSFPTKYQYQRHQCEFNAEKVVLKSDSSCNEVENEIPEKYVCKFCNKQFVNRNNLTRHQSSHENIQENVCEHCSKQFISENRLRIHKENHCKKAGDISKFYRSDVAVWKCKKCHEVFSSPSTANYHVASCSEIVDIDEHNEKLTQSNSDDTNSTTNESFNSSNKEVVVDENIEKVLTELLLQCEFCNRTYAEKNLLLMHQRKHTTLRNYECVNCLQDFESYLLAAQHWMKKCSEYVSLFYLPKLMYCEYCDRTFKSHELLYTHKIKKKHYTSKLHLPNTENVLPENNNDSNNNTTEENIDNKEMLSKLIGDVVNTLDVPVKNINHQPEPDAVEQNKENVDKTNEEIENNNCLDTAEKKKRGRKRKCLKNQCTRMKKLSFEVGEGFKYQCERCIKVFNTIEEFEAHREQEHSSNFTCEECCQVLHSAKALMIHSRAHKMLKPYVCDTCGRSYSQTSHLWQHMRFHQGIKPFACPHEGCESRYTIRPDLKDHIRKAHTRERPFKCNVCDKSFLTGSVYYQHRLIHTNDRRYACDLCPKRFFRADALNNHRRIHTDERPYPCSVCGREFRQKGDRNKHLRTQHPDTLLD